MVMPWEAVQGSCSSLEREAEAQESRLGDEQTGLTSVSPTVKQPWLFCVRLSLVLLCLGTFLIAAVVRGPV